MRVLAAILIGVAACKQGDAPAKAANDVKSLFDGKSLGDWKITQFGGEGEVKVENGQLILSMGHNMTGVTWGKEPPARMNYELELDAMRTDGNDFFCGLTFPVGKDACSLIVGGWGGGLVGISSLDGFDASENETTSIRQFEKNKWYHIRVRVSKAKIEAWIDKDRVVDVETQGRKIGIRIEVEPNVPLGICTYATTSAIKNIRLRNLP